MHLHDRRKPESLSSDAQVGVSQRRPQVRVSGQGATSVSPSSTIGDLASAERSEAQLASQKWEVAGLVAWRAAMLGEPGFVEIGITS